MNESSSNWIYNYYSRPTLATNKFLRGDFFSMSRNMCSNPLTLMITSTYFEKTASFGVLQPPSTVQNLVHYII